MERILATDGNDDFWDGPFYRGTCDFVPDLGEELIDLLDPHPSEAVLDVGCGTGELTKKISQSCEDVLGLDASPSMIEEARKHHPDLTFVCDDVKTYEPGRTFDAVFSNAALHWMAAPKRVLESIAGTLEPRGRFVAEMGCQGNVRRIRDALHDELSGRGYDPTDYDPWYFPDKDDYLKRLEDNGFELQDAERLHRPTELLGEEGLSLWLMMFAGPFLKPLDETQSKDVLHSVMDQLREDRYKQDRWVLDYRVLRFKAIKNGT